MNETASGTPVTSYIGNVIGVARTLDAYGMDGAAVLREVGIDVEATPSFDARIPASLVHSALVKYARDKLDPLFGIKFAQCINPLTYHAFGVMLTSSTTLRAFCQRWHRYYAYINTGDRIDLDDQCVLTYRQAALPESGDADFEKLLHESAWSATMLKMIRAVAWPEYAPLKATMAFSEPEGYTDKFNAFFRCPIEYSAGKTSLYFNEEDLDSPLPGGNAELARHSEMLVYNYLKTFTEVNIVNAARMSLFELLPRGDFSLASLAASLDMEEEGLSSQFKAAGVSYQHLLGDTRRELAEEYIVRADLSVNEIAYMLGFSDCSNFARSFRRWTGKSPSDFREDLHKRQ